MKKIILIIFLVTVSCYAQLTTTPAYLNVQLNNYATLASPVFTGTPVLPSGTTYGGTSLTTLFDAKLSKSGGTMTGALGLVKATVSVDLGVLTGTANGQDVIITCSNNPGIGTGAVVTIDITNSYCTTSSSGTATLEFTGGTWLSAQIDHFATGHVFINLFNNSVGNISDNPIIHLILN